MSVLLTAPSLISQSIWVVDCGGGPHAHFTSLLDAIAGSAAGDTIILMRDESGGCFHVASGVTRIDKPVTIIGMTLGGQGGWFPFQGYGGLFEITGIPAGERVVISGIVNGPASGWGSGELYGFDIHDCAGRVVLHDTAMNNLGFTGATFDIANCDDVWMTDVSLYMGGQPMRITNSRLTMNVCRVFHRSPFPSSSVPNIFTQTAEGMHVVDSTVTLLASLVFGASAENLSPALAWRFRPAALLRNSTIEVGPDALLTGGAPLSGGTSLAYNYLNGATGGEFVLEDPRGTIPEPPTGGSPGVGPVPTPVRMDTVSHNAAFVGSSFVYLISGADNGYAVLGIGSAQQPPVATPYGDLFLDPQSFVIASCQALDGVGLGNGTIQVPAGLPVGHPFVMQAMLLDPQGAFALTRPAPLYFGWGQGVAPY